MTGDAYQENPLNPGRAAGTWVPDPQILVPYGTPPGKFDTQGFLFAKFGLSEDEVNQGSLLLPEFLDTEEELVQGVFPRLYDEPIPQVSNMPFPIDLLAVSRRVTVRAIAHGFTVKALAIDGIDPLADPGAIYQGRYPFSKKIHVLTRTQAPPGAAALVQLMQSAAGQRLLEQAAFLPLPAGK